MGRKNNMCGAAGRVAALFAFAFALNGANAGISAVIIDTGHTPQRPGSIGPGGTPEYEFNLRLSSYIAKDLQKRGTRVIRVSADGRDIALNRRTAATQYNSLFVSIHHDSIQQAWIDQGRRREFKGYSTFISERNPYRESSLFCAQRIGLRMQEVGEKPSLYHATPIKGENRPLIDHRLGVHRFDDLVVLHTARSPAVLVEAGVIANPDEESRLGSEDLARQLGAAIASAIVECIK